MKEFYEIRQDGKCYIWESVLAMWNDDLATFWRCFGDQGDVFEVHLKTDQFTGIYSDGYWECVEISGNLSNGAKYLCHSTSPQHAMEIMKVLPSCITSISVRLDPNPLRNWDKSRIDNRIQEWRQNMKLILSLILVGFIDCITIGKRLQVPDKDPTLKNLVYKVGLPKANAQLGDSYIWVPGTTQFSAKRITVISQNKPYSTWRFDMLLERSNCLSKSTPISDYSSCEPVDTNTKKLCVADVSLYDGNYASAESEVTCSKQ